LEAKSGRLRATFAVGCREGFAMAGVARWVWSEGCLGASLQAGGANLITSLPAAHRVESLPPFACLDTPPVGEASCVFRAYHLDDTLRGGLATGSICGQPAVVWLQRRGFEFSADTDIYDLPVYPVIEPAQADQRLLDWFFSTEPDREIGAMVRALPRLSAREIPNRIEFKRLFADKAIAREEMLRGALTRCLSEGDGSALSGDLAAIALFCRSPGIGLGKWIKGHAKELFAALGQPQDRARLHMLLAALGDTGTAQAEAAASAFATLQEAILQGAPGGSRPRRLLKDDQIVWARSPIRLDLAGGWTDTPPYCFEDGGAVVNLAANLNGQPPIQVFARVTEAPVLRVRSIDLGSAETIETYEQLAAFRDPSSSFSLPKAALALAGFHPAHLAGTAPASLKEQLEAFGGGIELSLLCAVPKGSGLGTSSILAATLLGSLNRACSLGWDEIELYRRVLVMEQLLTTGGGWQDQAGALFPGVKLIQTPAGLSQNPVVRFLPEHLFGGDFANTRLLLYYTGITRLAKHILQEIVRNMFLGERQTLLTLGQIRSNAWRAYQAIQQNRYDDLCRSVARSWTLNKRLDPGTSTPEIEGLIASCGSDLAAAKLLGAGGGGYLLLCARDEPAGRRIRSRLEASPPNARARFIDFQVASCGLQVTVS
jgi:galactokinase/mevalonate kinase-like predicted kinase